jgi:hypothetical protein
MGNEKGRDKTRGYLREEQHKGHHLNKRPDKRDLGKIKETERNGQK